MTPLPRTASILSKPHQHVRQTRPRCFSTTTTRRVDMRQPRMDLSKMMPAQRNAQSRMKNLKRSEVPDDMGVLPGTFIRPTYAEGPSLFSSDWRKRAKMDWVYFKQMSRDTLGMMWLRFFPGKNNSNAKVPMDKKERLGVAKSLHARLYLAIARGDVAGIEQVALSGLAQQQIARLHKRRMADEPAQQAWYCSYKGSGLAHRLYWILQPFVPYKEVKIVSDRFTDLPFGLGMQLRQFIVRVRSRQQLDKLDGSRPVTKDLVEYLVIQRVVVDGKREDWKIWGTTKPSTYEDAVEIESASKAESQGGSFVEKFKDRMNGMGLNL